METYEEENKVNETPRVGVKPTTTATEDQNSWSVENEKVSVEAEVEQQKKNVEQEKEKEQVEEKEEDKEKIDKDKDNDKNVDKEKEKEKVTAKVKITDRTETPEKHNRLREEDSYHSSTEADQTEKDDLVGMEADQTYVEKKPVEFKLKPEEDVKGSAETKVQEKEKEERAKRTLVLQEMSSWGGQKIKYKFSFQCQFYEMRIEIYCNWKIFFQMKIQFSLGGIQSGKISYGGKM